MQLAHDLLIQLRQAFEDRPPSRVKALHLPPAVWTGSKDAEFGAIELESGALGLSYLLLDDTLAAIGRSTTGVAGADPFELAQWWVEAASPARSALGFAAVNALTREAFDRIGFRPPAAPDSFGGIRPQPGEAIGMVGFFPPLVKPVAAAGARLTVLELRADLAGAHDGFRVTLDPAELAGCTQVLSTSTVLLNHTLESVLAACRSARRLVLVGPGAGCLPDPLFARGVSALGGTWIDDAAAFKAALAEGGSWSAAATKFLLESAGYPGLAALRGRR